MRGCAYSLQVLRALTGYCGPLFFRPHMLHRSRSHKCRKRDSPPGKLSPLPDLSRTENLHHVPHSTVSLTSKPKRFNFREPVNHIVGESDKTNSKPSDAKRVSSAFIFCSVKVRYKSIHEASLPSVRTTPLCSLLFERTLAAVRLDRSTAASVTAAWRDSTTTAGGW